MYNKLNLKVNNLDNKIPDEFTLIQTDKQNLEKKIRDADKKYLTLWVY